VCAACNERANEVADELIGKDFLVRFLRSFYAIADRYGKRPPRRSSRSGCRPAGSSRPRCTTTDRPSRRAYRRLWLRNSLSPIPPTKAI
jgi:hypothetical protein